MNKGDMFIYGSLLIMGVGAAIVVAVSFAVAIYHLLGML